MREWSDGRSGVVGCCAGNLALEHLAASEGPLRRVKGTVFEGPRSVLIGRASSSEYLTDPVLHWANASWDQHVDLSREATSSGKRLWYLFVTASKEPAAVRTWKVPAEIVEAVFRSRGRDHRGASCAIHVIAAGRRQLIGKNEVSRYHGRLTLNDADAARLTQAFGAAADVEAGARDRLVPAARRQPGRGAWRSTSYGIPVSGGRSVTVQIPGPLSGEDVSRVKSWIDLSSDVLTEGYENLKAGEEGRWLREQVRAGLDQLANGESVEGEEAFARVLGKGRKHRGTGP